MVGCKESVRAAQNAAAGIRFDCFPLCYYSPAPVPVSKAQQLVEQAQAAGLPTEQDFATATPIVTTPDSLDGIFPQLAQLMEANHVFPEELQQVVGEKGIFSGRYARQSVSAGFRRGLVHPVVEKHLRYDSAEPKRPVLMQANKTNQGKFRKVGIFHGKL